MRIKSLLAAPVFMLTFMLMFALTAGTAFAQDKVVYHFDNAAAQGLKGLRNVRNHIDTEYATLVSALKSRGVTFEICEITLRNRSLKKEQFIQEADFTLSGVVRIAKLQGQGYAYIKP